jgi:ABC-type polysaccharide/polyol phosphate transport system ATPase subunit
MNAAAKPVESEPMGSKSPAAVRLNGVSKRFILHKQKPFLLHDTIRRVLGRQSGEEFWALRDVSFEIRRGESVALMGGNGAGKSTTLGIVARTVIPTAGTVEVNGRVGALLELGAGFHPDLTGRENIYLNASLLGLNREEVERQFRKIVIFSELIDFIDVPLRNYSSGMQVRLGFSVAVHINPDILLMDEVFAVGDVHFQRKCIERVMSFKKEGKTLVFVSHSPESVKRLCERVIWLDHGHVCADGPTDEILPAYAQAMQ